MLSPPWPLAVTSRSLQARTVCCQLIRMCFNLKLTSAGILMSRFGFMWTDNVGTTLRQSPHIVLPDVGQYLKGTEELCVEWYLKIFYNIPFLNVTFIFGCPYIYSFFLTVCISSVQDFLSHVKLSFLSRWSTCRTWSSLPWNWSNLVTPHLYPCIYSR